MNGKLLAIITSVLVVAAQTCRADDTTFDFYDAAGRAVAFSAKDGSDVTLYLWSGKPVAYPDGDSVYGFNGRHIGWYQNGAIYDNDGNLIAALASRFASPVEPAPPKGFKGFRPFKAFKEFRPFKPLFGQTWSKVSAKILFLLGVDDGVDFYDSSGRAVAYIVGDRDLTMYLWEGSPVAYLHEDSVYGFNGKHLGWLRNDAVHDREGNVVAAFADRFRVPVSPAPFKGLKQLRPLKSLMELKSLQPLFSLNWSKLPAKLFFMQGVD